MLLFSSERGVACVIQVILRGRSPREILGKPMPSRAIPSHFIYYWIWHCLGFVIGYTNGLVNGYTLTMLLTLSLTMVIYLLCLFRKYIYKLVHTNKKSNLLFLIRIPSRVYVIYLKTDRTSGMWRTESWIFLSSEYEKNAIILK